MRQGYTLGISLELLVTHGLVIGPLSARCITSMDALHAGEEVRRDTQDETYCAFTCDALAFPFLRQLQGMYKINSCRREGSCEPNWAPQSRLIRCSDL